MSFGLFFRFRFQFIFQFQFGIKKMYFEEFANKSRNTQNEEI